MEPVVRYMILCEDARPRKGTHGKIDIFGVIHTLYTPTEAFPAALSFCVYVCLAGGRGRGLGQIAVIKEETEEFIYAGKPHSFDFGLDPMRTFASTIRIPRCAFPEPGLYRVEFAYNEMVLRKCPVLVRVKT